MKIRGADVVLLGLIVLAGTQVAIAMARRASAPIPPMPSFRFVAVGDTLGGVGVIDSSGVSHPLVDPDGPPLATLVMAFHSECVHCETVAADWAAWLATPRAGVRAVAVTREDVAVGHAYALAHGWSVEVVKVDAEPGDEGQALVARTPWLVLLDGEGLVSFHAQGEGLAALDQAIEELRTNHATDEEMATAVRRP
jgi:hypothetical protein